METPFQAYSGDEPYVFVCYAHEDASTASVGAVSAGGVMVLTSSSGNASAAAMKSS